MRKILPETLDLTDLSLDSIEAFNLIYVKYCDAIYSNIFKLVKQHEHSQDILQEVFVSLWQNRHQLKQDQSVSGWLFVVSYNKALKFLKKSVKLSLNYVEDYDAFEHLVPEEGLDESVYLSQISILEEAVDALPERKKQVFRLCRFEGKSKEEVALLLGISATSVKDYLKQSNRSIKDYLAANYPYGTAGIVSLLILLAD